MYPAIVVPLSLSLSLSLSHGIHGFPSPSKAPTPTQSQTFLLLLLLLPIALILQLCFFFFTEHRVNFHDEQRQNRLLNHEDCNVQQRKLWRASCEIDWQDRPYQAWVSTSLFCFKHGFGCGFVFRFDFLISFFVLLNWFWWALVTVARLGLCSDFYGFDCCFGDWMKYYFIVMFILFYCVKR